MSTGGNKRGKYLGFVAHEIKNPLATALWSCDLIKRMDSTDRAGERAEKMVDASLRALRRMRRLIDDYFTIERLLEHGYDLKREQLELKDLIAQTVQLLHDKDAIATEGWSLELEGARVSGDGEMLKRGLRALLEHFARASPKPRLIVQARPGETGCQLSIRADLPPQPVVPPPPEDRNSGDPQGAVLGYLLAEKILEAHGATLKEQDGGLLITFQ